MECRSRDDAHHRIRGDRTVSVTTASGSRIDGTKARNLLRASLSGNQATQTIAAGWSTNGGTNYSVTGPGIVVATFGVTVLTLDGVSKVSTDANGLVYMPFASTAVITGTAHGIYTTRYSPGIAIPTNAVKTISTFTHTYTGAGGSWTDNVTTGGGFLWSVYGSGDSSHATNGDSSITWSVRHNGTSTGGADRTLWSASMYRSTSSGGFNTGGAGAGMMFPFDGTLKLVSGISGASYTGNSSITAIWSATLPAA